MTRLWTKAKAISTPSSVAQTKAKTVIFSVVSKALNSSPASATRVCATSSGEGTRNFGISNAVTSPCQSAIRNSATSEG